MGARKYSRVFKMRIFLLLKQDHRKVRKFGGGGSSNPKPFERVRIML